MLPATRRRPGETWRLDVELPPWRPIKQKFQSHALASPAGSVVAQLARPDISNRIKPGMRVAVGVGSRGIGCLHEVVKEVVAGIRRMGGEPFIVPAMGSHAGGTAEGQTMLLESYGVSEEAVGAPIRASMDTVDVGDVLDGIHVVFDRIALTEADAVVPVARVKPHSDFRGEVESGLQKMLAIGLGKRQGAMYMHTFPLDRFGELIPAAANLILQRANVPFGVAIVEDSYEHAAIIEAVPGEAIAAREPELLKQARLWMPQLPISQMDILLVQEMGKDISGAGMDPNVTGRYTMPSMKRHVHIRRLVVLGLTENTHGNATAMGMSDIVTRRLAQEVDFFSTYMNHVSSNSIEGAKLPLVAETDQEAVAIAALNLGRTPPQAATLAWIQNTLRLDRLWVNEPLWESVRENPIVEPTGDFQPMAFDESGGLVVNWPG
jgi:hypothetical protein